MGMDLGLYPGLKKYRIRMIILMVRMIAIYMVLEPCPITKNTFQLKMGFEGSHWVDMVSGINVGVLKCQAY